MEDVERQTILLTAHEAGNEVPQGPQPPPAFYALNLSGIETLLTYQAYRLLLKHYAAQENEPLENIQQVTGLMTLIKPSAIEASKLFAPQQGGQGNDRN